MELIADLKFFPAADALQWAAGSHFDGELIFRRNRRTLTLSLDKGRIVRSESSEKLESFGQHLFAQGLVDARQLRAAAKRGEAHQLGITLIELNVIGRDELRAALTDYTLDLSCSVIPWPDGVVSVHASKLRPLTDPESEPVDAVFTTMEASRRVDEFARLRRNLPHDNIELGKGKFADPGDLDAAEQRLLEMFRSRHTIGDLYRLIGGCRFSFLKRVSELIHRRHLTRLHVGSMPRPAGENQTSLVDVVFDGHLSHRLHA